MKGPLYSVHVSCDSTDWGRIGYATTERGALRMVRRWLREQGRMREPIGRRGKWSMRNPSGYTLAGGTE